MKGKAFSQAFAESVGGLDSRSQFEAWQLALNKNANLSRSKWGSEFDVAPYKSATIEQRWQCWQVAKACFHTEEREKAEDPLLAAVKSRARSLKERDASAEHIESVEEFARRIEAGF